MKNFISKNWHHHHHFWQAPLRVCSAERRHPSPEWTVLSQVNCIIHIKVAGFQIQKLHYLELIARYWFWIQQARKVLFSTQYNPPLANIGQYAIP